MGSSSARQVFPQLPPHSWYTIPRVQFSSTKLSVVSHLQLKLECYVIDFVCQFFTVLCHSWLTNTIVPIFYRRYRFDISFQYITLQILTCVVLFPKQRRHKVPCQQITLDQQRINVDRLIQCWFYVYSTVSAGWGDACGTTGWLDHIVTTHSSHIKSEISVFHRTISVQILSFEFWMYFFLRP